MTKDKEIKREEAKKFIEELAEKKRSMIEIFSIAEGLADKRLQKVNPKCHLVKTKINKEDLFKTLRAKLEEKKKLTNYPNAKTKEERQVHNDIQELESSLYDTFKIPLFKIGLAENLGEGLDYLIDEILLSTESFSKKVEKGRKAATTLYPGSKSYEYSEEAEEFIDFMSCEKEDYRAFATEFLKKLCGE